jgi:hypothetical protein
MRTLTFVATTLLFWGCAALADEPSEHDMAAAKTLANLVSLEEGPKALVRQCKAVDPAGTKKRQALYDSWISRHKVLFEKIDGYTKSIVPILFADVAQGHRDPTATFRSKEAEATQQEIASLPPEEKLKICKNFAGAGFFDDERTDAVTKGAFDLLDAWRKERGQGAA